MSRAARRGYYAEILLISCAGLLLEVSYTRVISFKLFYYYTYLVIGLALLGIGTGGVLVAVSDRLRRASTDAIIMWGSLLGALSVAVGYLVVARIPIATLTIWSYRAGSVSTLARLFVLCIALFASFIAIGVMIATLFGRRSELIGRLYFADLAGAGLACLVVVWLIGSIGPPATIFLAGLILAGTGLSLAIRDRSRVAPLGALLSVLLAIVVIAPDLLPDVKEDTSKGELINTLSHEWSPIFRVDVDDFENRLLLLHDGLLGSIIIRWDGDIASLAELNFEEDPRSFPFETLAEPPGNVMIIGAAGGHEVLTSLYFEAGHIDAIELNPVTHSLVTDKYAEYSGRFAERPNVNYVTGDGRSFLARSDDDYDLIWYPAPDSYSATNAAHAGAFVLSESYLYTSETIVDSLEHLADDGIVAAQFGELNFDLRANRTIRYVGTARHALEKLGIDDPTGHIIVATSSSGGASSLSTVLVKRTPFTRDEIARFMASQDSIPGTQLRYAPGQEYSGSAVSDVVTLPKRDLDKWYESYPYSVEPITDDGPFFWHFSRFSDVVRDLGTRLDESDPEIVTGERVLLLLLALATVLAAVFLLIPFVAVREIWVALPRKPRSALYFTSLGFGFMFFEITLIQRLTLFLGYPTYSLTVTLASILIFTGVGALLTERYRDRPARVMPVLLAAITVLTLFYLLGMKPLTDGLLGAPLGLRVPIAFGLLAPLGICLGAFMPLGLGAVARLTEYSREYVAWGWAVNGFASVVGAVLTTLLAMVFGFRVVLLLGLVVYFIALAVLRGLLRAAPNESAHASIVDVRAGLPAEPAPTYQS
jgi:hypothetical protein